MFEHEHRNMQAEVPCPRGTAATGDRVALHRCSPKQQVQDLSQCVFIALAGTRQLRARGIHHHPLTTCSSRWLITGIPNLKVLETLDSVKKADALEKTLASQEPQDRVLDVFLQVNTSAEDVKSGLPALEAPPDALAEGASLDTVPTLAKHIQDHCPHLRLAGLMTIGSWEHSHEEPEQENPDFVKLTQTRNYLAGFLNVPKESLELSMGMSADFVQATKQGSDNVRVGSKAFGTRPSKEEAKALRGA